MGRSRRQRQERQLEEALANALLAGMKRGERTAFERVLRASVSEVLGLEVRDVEGFVRDVGAEKALPLITEAAATVFPSRYRAVLTPVLSAIMEAAGETKAPVLGSFTLRNPRMRDFLDGYVSRLSETLPKTSYDNFERVLREGLDEGLSTANMAERLRERVGEINASRAELISRTELLNAERGATHLQITESGVPIKRKVWKSAGDERVRAEHRALDGVAVGLNEDFPGGEGLYPSKPRCRCVVIYEPNLEALNGGAA